MSIDIYNNTITTANALIYKKEGAETYFLLVQENDGNWGLPGGAKEIEDADLFATIKRELKEELALAENDYSVQETPITREFEYSHIRSSRFGKHGVVQLFVVSVFNMAKIKRSGELADIAWFTKKEASRKLTFQHIREGFEEIIDILPALSS